jgi:hypothetical protein
MKNLVESCQRIDINELVRTTKAELLKLRLQSRINSLEQDLEVITTPCRFGGHRYWFVCPGCNHKVGVLYRPPLSNELRCRKCHNLTYTRTRYHKMI